MRKARKRTFLCKEPGGANLPDEEFIITAKDMDDAREQASLWNAVVIREIVKKRKQNENPNRKSKNQNRKRRTQ